MMQQFAVRLFDLASRFRFTLLFLTVMLIANIAAGTLEGKLPDDMLAIWGIGQDSVWSGDIARLFTGTFLSHDVDMFFRQVVFAAIALGYTEKVRGSWGAAGAFFALDITSTLVLLTTIWMIPMLSDIAALNDVGMSMGGFSLVGLAIAGMRYRWILCIAVLLAIIAKIAIDFEPLTDTGHIIALMLGFLSGLLGIWRKTPEHHSE
tara:strand:+ start:183 stop:800 length:618 start_codon:yes stop_codon:yes gene_type:complete